METGKVKRIKILNVPVDIVSEECLTDTVCRLAEDGKVNQIILLDFIGFMKARRLKSEWRKSLEEAALILPVSYRIINAARFLNVEKPVHYKSFDFIITLMGILENRRKSAYLLGSTKKRIQKSATNLINSFPGLRFVGRFQGNWDNNREQDIVMAIKKSSPSFLLVGRGVKGKNLWLYRNRDNLNPGITLWNKNCYEIIGGSKSKPSETKVSRLFRNILKCLFIPWRWPHFFRQLWFWILLICNRLFRSTPELT